MSDALVIRRRSLGHLEHIGQGGTATVYGLPHLAAEDLDVDAPQGLAYKEYTPRTRERAGPGLTPGLQAMVELRGRLDPRQRSRWDQHVVWPVRLVVDDEGQANGIIMPLLPERFFQRVTRRDGEVRSVPREADKLFGDVMTMRRIGVAPVSQEVRVELVTHIAYAYGLMHFSDVVVGDISHRNLVYDPDPEHPAVMIYDTDSARLVGNASAFGSQLHTPRWEPPEALAARGTAALTAQNKATDVYKFALLIVRILDYGQDRSVNRDPVRAAPVLRRACGARAADLLLASLSDRPADRPTMREWHDALRRTSGRAEMPAPRLRTPRAQAPAPPTDGDRLVDGMVVGDWVFRADSGWHRRSAHG
ncbi:protein kinase [Paractinoplanes atraurantiacus]|uniref:Protein tyrosine kinase n=1 Tax=Paractinoplanes atraurantiacus TaxID=1036182 RepID=A0A285JZQ9_9ACTN|nr:protein kinase [Actinoplanes atraurantiacus]SNY65257.1 Protein tyrosine kinase [Actinoplanes atraurantiacus]